MKKSKKKKIMEEKNFKKYVSIIREKINVFKGNNKSTLVIFIGVFLVVIIFLFISSSIRNSSLNKVVLTIDDSDYTKSDFMVYFYSVKYDYFKDDVDNITKDDMEIVFNNDNNVTLGEYLKEKTLDEIKTATVIREYASKNNVELSDKDYTKLEEEKKKYIKSLGGRSKFKRLLRNNSTTEKSYDKMVETDKLYEKILEKLYGEGKRKDLTEEELLDARNNYKNHYFKIEQVILTTIDVETRKSLSDTVINQKKALAETIYNYAIDGSDFEELVGKYSESAIDKEPPYYEYYKVGDLLTEIESAILELDDNSVSGVIQTNYAFHIIKKLEMDDSKFDEYLDELREEKALKDLNQSLDNLKIIYRDAYKKIKY